MQYLKCNKIWTNRSGNNFISCIWISDGPRCIVKTGLASNLNHTRELISNTPSLSICVMARETSNLNGFAWNSKTRDCYGIKDAIVINTKETIWKSCIFDSKLRNKCMSKNYRVNIKDITVIFCCKRHSLKIRNLNEIMFLGPCEPGYRYQKGTTDANPIANHKYTDNVACAFFCTNDHRCASYEYYDSNCKLFDTNVVTNQHSSGYVHCEKKGSFEVSK